VDDMELQKKLDKSDYLGAYTTIENTLSKQILPFAQVNTPFHNDHGVGHSKRVIEYIEKILGNQGVKKLNDIEAFLLLSSAWFHDIGLLINEYNGKILISDEIRSKHHMLSQIFIIQNYPIFGIRSEHLAKSIGDLCFTHRRMVSIESFFLQDPINLLGKEVRLQFLAGVLRLADALDCDARRAPEIDSKYIMKLPETQIIHWRCCQLLTGVGIDYRNQSIIIDACQKDLKDYEIILWKIKDVNIEFDSVSSILHRNNIHISRLIGRVKSPLSNDVLTFDIKDILAKEKEIAEANSQVRDECIKALIRLWKVNLSLRNKISQSQDIFKQYKKYPFSENISLLYLQQSHIMEYFEKGICKTKLRLNLVNISDNEISSDTFTAQGIVPMTDKGIRLTGFDKTAKKNLDFTIVNSTPNEKEIRINFEPIKPGEVKDLEVHYCWNYPEPLSGFRWYYVPIDCFTLNLVIQIIIPNKYHIITANSCLEKQNWIIDEKDISIRKKVRYNVVKFRNYLPEEGTVWKIYWNIRPNGSKQKSI